MVIVIAALICGIAYYQVRQGLYSSLIMAVCCVLSAILAMTMYPSLASALGLYTEHGVLADALCIALMFVVPLVVLRYLADRFIWNDIYFDVWVERIGGTVLGLISGMVMMGILLVVLQMLPLGENILGIYQPYGNDLTRKQRVWPFFPDDFVVSLGRIASRGSMSGDRAYGDVHDDLLLEAAAARNTAGCNGTLAAKPDTLKVLGTYELDPQLDLGRDIPANPLIRETRPGTLTRVIIVRTAVNGMTADGEPTWFRLPGTHFRLICSNHKSYYPIGYLFYKKSVIKSDGQVQLPRGAKVIGSRSSFEVTPKKLIGTVPAGTSVSYFKPTVEPAGDKTLTPAQLIVARPLDTAMYTKTKASQKDISLVVDWVYRIPKDAQPETVVFRRVAAAPVRGKSKPFIEIEDTMTLMKAEYPSALRPKPSSKRKR